ncbi:hypothetical protein [Candidatus Stoquefichus massiliensis]|uniref:hypothetical protein n=1 Tax=Candidatus Stoquefichus massiliensis TaxID=1470350 RepID=UPI000482A19A|nr:hypothetical protein [Candidatus Stoquefichus massiliensis]
MKKYNLIPYILTLIMVCLMVGCSQLLNEPEIIFPEITALTIGAWLVPKQVWKTSPIKLVILIMIYAIIGVSMVRYLHISLTYKVMIAFLFCNIGLIISKTTFAPLISACILPILMGTESWIYPISATIMSVIIVLVQIVLQKKELCHAYHYVPVQFDYQHECILFIKRFIVVSVLGFLAIRLENRLLIAPPLIVAFFELSGNHKKLRSNAPKLYIFTVFMAFISAYLRYYFTIQNQISILFVVTIATVILLLCIYYFQIFFPPIGAITILPMIIQSELLPIYPFLIAIGFALLIIFAFLISYQGKE